MHAYGDEAKVAAILDDYHSAPIDSRLKATLGFLEKLTLVPAEVGPDDIRTLRAAGVSDRAIREAIYVCFVFSIMDRLADALDFKVSDVRARKWIARILTRVGYGSASVPG